MTSTRSTGTSFPGAVRTCLLRKYADFGGRASRGEYWFFVLFAALVTLGAVLGVFAAGAGPHPPAVLPFVTPFVGLVLAVPTLAVTVRRLHDTGRSGWWYVVGWVPLGGFVLLALLLTRGTGDNRYGPDPHGPGPRRRSERSVVARR